MKGVATEIVAASAEIDLVTSSMGQRASIILFITVDL